jgi:hypothetical protein
MKGYDAPENASAFLGRRSRCGAGGHSTTGTGPESTGPRARRVGLPERGHSQAAAEPGGPSGLRRAYALSPAGADAGEGRG